MWTLVKTVVERVFDLVVDPPVEPNDTTDYSPPPDGTALNPAHVSDIHVNGDKCELAAVHSSVLLPGLTEASRLRVGDAK